MVMIRTAKELKNAISDLENQRSEQYVQLKEHFVHTVDQFSLVNILKNTLDEFKFSNEFVQGFFISIAGLLSGFLAKKVLFKKKENAFSGMIIPLLRVIIERFFSRSPKRPS